jgi:hypothetical protein
VVITVTGIGTPDLITSSIFVPPSLETVVTVGAPVIVQGGSGNWIAITLSISVLERGMTVSVVDRTVTSDVAEQGLDPTVWEVWEVVP